jgi:RHS repeat-associated protein
MLGGKRIAVRNASGLYYLHGDHLGSSSLTTNAAGSIVSQLRYLPFGGTRWESGATPTDFQFTGQRKEAGIGLYDYHARFYDPLIGRFISSDPLVMPPSNPQALNRYSYVLNNPLRYTDPTGHCPGCLLAFGAAGALTGMAGYLATACFFDGCRVDTASLAVAGGVGFVFGIMPLYVVGQGAWMIASMAIIGASSNGAQYMLDQWVHGQQIDPQALAINMALGGIVGVRAGKIPVPEGVNVPWWYILRYWSTLPEFFPRHALTLASAQIARRQFAQSVSSSQGIRGIVEGQILPALISPQPVEAASENIAPSNVSPVTGIGNTMPFSLSGLSDALQAFLNGGSVVTSSPSYLSYPFPGFGPFPGDPSPSSPEIPDCGGSPIEQCY